MRVGTALILALGIAVFAEGYCANLTGKTIPQTTKNGPMSGTQAMAIGAVLCVYGTAWVVIAARRKK